MYQQKICEFFWSLRKLLIEHITHCLRIIMTEMTVSFCVSFNYSLLLNESQFERVVPQQ